MSFYTCPFCADKTYETILSLTRHWTKTHKQTTESLYLSLKGMESPPVCGCGCGEPVKFLDAGRGYSEYVWGHKSRVSNNFQTEKSKNNSKSTRRKMLEEGTWKPFATKETGEHWSKGLTKKTDERIRKMAETISLPEESKKRSERMRKNRLSGIVRTLNKEEHSQWKGGISSLNVICRNDPMLYSKWKYPILKANLFRCSRCNSTKDVVVHHDKETFSEIMNRYAKNHKWEQAKSTYIDPEDIHLKSLKEHISSEVVKYHIENNVSGIVLCQECHKAIHNKHNL